MPVPALSARLSRLLAALRDIARVLPPRLSPSRSRTLQQALDRALGKAEFVEVVEVHFPWQELTSITQADLDRWFTVLDESLVLHADSAVLTIGPWDATFASHNRQDLTNFLALVTQYTTPRVNAFYTITKSKLTESLSVPGLAPGDVHRFFFFAAAFARFLSRASFEELEELLLGDPPADRRTVVLVADSPGRLEGACLAVLGNPDCDAFIGFGKAPAPAFDQVRAVMRDQTSWPGRDRLLTPDHLAVASPQGLPAIAAQLTRLENRLIVPFLANRSGAQGDEYMFVGERTRAVQLGDESASRDLYGLYRWVYGDPAAAARLEISRRVIAAALWGDPGGNFQSLIRDSPRLRSDAQFQLDLLMDRNIAETFDRRQKIETAVADYVGKVQASIESLGQEVVDNVYKTAGLLVGIVIAYLLEPDKKVMVALLGGGLYIAYLVFILFFYLTSLSAQFSSQKRAFARRLAEDRRVGVLPAPVMRRLAAQVRLQGMAFTAMYRCVRKIYWGFIVVTIALGIAWLGWQGFVHLFEIATD